MKFIETALASAYVIEPAVKQDERGMFMRVFCKKDFAAIGHSREFVQFNHSLSVKKGTIRGMHFQYKPYQEIKLVRCIAGSVLDVIIDLRKDSPTFLKHTSVVLSKENKKMIYIPEGFAHGFQTLEDNSELSYHHTAYYHPEAEAGLRFDDPMLSIEFPLPVSSMSERDQQFPYLSVSSLNLLHEEKK
jgi:dTDP-4-dehydrorhamnose 3,5-epimerase